MCIPLISECLFAALPSNQQAVLQFPGARPTSTSIVCVTEDVYSESPSMSFIVVCNCDAAVRRYVTDTTVTT